MGFTQIVKLAKKCDVVGTSENKCEISAYSILLSDGSTVDFVPQKGTSKVRILKKDSALLLESGLCILQIIISIMILNTVI